MSVGKIMNAIDPRNLHDGVMNKMDQVKIQERSTAGNVFIKAPALVGLSIAGLVTNVAAATTEAFNLLGKLALAGVKYGVMKPVRAFLNNDTFTETMAKMPNGASLLATAKKLGALALGVIYSATGLVAPTFNLRRQEELGNFVNNRKVAEEVQAKEEQKAIEAQKTLEAHAAEEAEKAEAEKELAQAQAAVRKIGVPVAKHAAAVARGEFAIGKAWMAKKALSKKIEASKALFRPIVKEAAQVFADRQERIANAAYLEKFAVAEQLMDQDTVPAVRSLPDFRSEDALINAQRRKNEKQERIANAAYLEKFAVAEQLMDQDTVPAVRSLLDFRSEDALINAQKEINKTFQALKDKAYDAAKAPVAAAPAPAPAPAAAPAVMKTGLGSRIANLVPNFFLHNPLSRGVGTLFGY